ncbi:class I SAM-dependent methyltransferase [Synechococcus sp. CS-1324]|uniref:class I SAM-dependent methyltransferase n=1 Tax=Synechococcus sp. CS-1324 TaxID=2847980 RepID=UPI00223A7D01|nr:class I SAM-dependent methyltransferase [Synechococcus sp. CS-1324]MCT0229475.1 class I SAM-dependent methyltransferase [Synechococcus sp. CS-1324]
MKNLGVNMFHFFPKRLKTALRNKWLFFVRQDLILDRLTKLEESVENYRVHEIAQYLIKSHWAVLDRLHLLAEKDRILCYLCGHEDDKSAFKCYSSTCIFLGGELIRRQCPCCDVIFGPAKVLEMEEEMLEFDYRLHYQLYSEGDSTDRILRSFELLGLKKEGVYLDYGCGVAKPKALLTLRSQGYQIYGFEPSLVNSSDWVFATTEELSRYRFNGIITHNVLEHLTDPIGVTSMLKELLLPDGKLVHATPCYDYLYEYTRFHVFFFMGRSLEFLAASAGMKLCEFIQSDDSDYMAAVLTPLGGMTDA